MRSQPSSTVFHHALIVSCAQRPFFGCTSSQWKGRWGRVKAAETMTQICPRRHALRGAVGQRHLQKTKGKGIGAANVDGLLNRNNLLRNEKNPHEEVLYNVGLQPSPQKVVRPPWHPPQSHLLNGGRPGALGILQMWRFTEGLTQQRQHHQQSTIMPRVRSHCTPAKPSRREPAPTFALVSGVVFFFR